LKFSEVIPERPQAEPGTHEHRQIEYRALLLRHHLRCPFSWVPGSSLRYAPE
jgi:hypothetical protein